MSISSQVTPRSVLRHRPLNSDNAPKEKPTVIRASRPTLTTKKMVPPVSCSPQKTTTLKKGSSPLHRTSIVFGMMVAIVAVLLGQLLIGWFMATWDDIHYGYPRTFQIDAFVGHEMSHTPSHFIALNLSGRIEIIELQGGDPSKTKMYLGPIITSPGADLVPVTLQFVDPHHTHHPDMLILFHDTHIVFHNMQNTFQL